MLSVSSRPSSRRTAAWAAAAVLAFTLTTPSADARGGPDSFAPLAKQVSPAVVNIAVVRDVQSKAESQPSPFPPGSPWDQFLRRSVPRDNGAPRRVTGVGSGFVIDPSGYVVTNNHVVGDASDIAVTFNDGRQLKARLVGRDDKTDLALIKVESPTPLAAVPWGDSDRIEVGDWVLAVGNPFGLGGTVTAGIVSARGRDIQAGPYDDFLQLDAPINQGNSGGPSFNLAGEVIGVNTAIYSPNGGSVGIGFAIPSAVAKPVVEQLREHGRIERGWIGVSVQPLTPEIAFGFGLGADQDGALIAQLDPSGPAAKAGLRQGDVIVAVDRTRITQLRDLPRLVAGYKPGTRVSVEVRRRGNAMTLPLTIGPTPANNRADAAPADSAPRAVEPVGLALAPLTPDLRERLHLGPAAHGVVIAAVRDGSEAERAGLVVGDLIVGIGGDAVTAPAEVEKALGAARNDRRDSVVLLVDRRGMEQFVALKLPRPAG